MLPDIHSSYLLLPFIPSKTMYKTTAILFSYNIALGIQRRDSTFKNKNEKGSKGSDGNKRLMR